MNPASDRTDQAVSLPGTNRYRSFSRFLSGIYQSTGAFRINDFAAFRAFCEYSLLAVRLELDDRLVFGNSSVTERAVSERLIFDCHRETGVEPWSV